MPFPRRRDQPAFKCHQIYMSWMGKQASRNVKTSSAQKTSASIVRARRDSRLHSDSPGDSQRPGVQFGVQGARTSNESASRRFARRRAVEFSFPPAETVEYSESAPQ